ncbi:MAG: zinc ABC transporter substrate-binding protein [Rhodospirillaceae bacterium]|nr:zinc ABC transporter substrate-binding protein [Rhodospirillaceae bacterium]
MAPLMLAIPSRDVLAAPPKVVATIMPIHALVSGVMAGVGEPDLLVSGYNSPHNYQMRPSEARSLSAADVVVWVGPTLETFLIQPLKTIAGDSHVVTLLDSPGLTVRSFRGAGIWAEEERKHAGADEHEDHDDEEDHDHHHHEGSIDPHIWLSPDNARVIVASVAEALSVVDPANRDRYRDNATDLEARIAAMDTRIDNDLSAVRDVPFIVFHDAYQYFERHYGLRSEGAITLGPDRIPGAGRISRLRALIRDRGIACVFTEPQFEPAIIATVIERTTARQGTLDPLGADLAAGADAYFAMMERNARSIAACLGRQNPN